MEKPITLANGQTILLRTAEVSGFLPGDPLPPGMRIEVHCGWDAEHGRSGFQAGAPWFAGWHRAQARILHSDTNMILAWESPSAIVGMLSFYADVPGGGGGPVDFAACCPLLDQTGAAADWSEIVAPAERPRDICLTCVFTIALRLKGLGLKSGMLAFLKELAGARGWRSISAVARRPPSVDHFWPTTSLMERAGFVPSGPILSLDGGRLEGQKMVCDVSPMAAA